MERPACSLRVWAIAAGSVVCAACMFLAAGGCGSRFEGGLANAPSIQRHNFPRARYDVVANGRDSCPRGDAGDPFPYRLAACEEEVTDGGRPHVRAQAW
jgi:hypothetical protein